MNVCVVEVVSILDLLVVSQIDLPVHVPIYGTFVPFGMKIDNTFTKEIDLVIHVSRF